MVDLLFTIVGGVFGGLISPFAVTWLQHTFVWKAERSAELRQQIFEDAVRTLSLMMVDALDSEFQARPRSGTYKRKVDFRPETFELIEKTRAMVRAFLSAEASEEFEKATQALVTLEAVPNTAFDEQRAKAISKIASEAGIAAPSIKRCLLATLCRFK